MPGFQYPFYSSGGEVLGNKGAKCGGETLGGIPGDGFYLSAGGESHQSDVSALFGCGTAEEHIDEGEQGV